MEIRHTRRTEVEYQDTCGVNHTLSCNDADELTLWDDYEYMIDRTDAAALVKLLTTHFNLENIDDE